MPDYEISPDHATDITSGFKKPIHAPHIARALNIFIEGEEGGRYFKLEVIPGPNCEFDDLVAGNREAEIDLTSEKLARVVADCQDAWKRNVVDKGVILSSVVTQWSFQRNWNFQNRSLLPEVLPRLARAGSTLFQTIFLPERSRRERQADPRLLAIGQALRNLTLQRELWIRVTSDVFFAPWDLMYSHAVDKAKGFEPVVDGFWGYRHLVEHVFTDEDLTSRLSPGKPIRMGLQVDTNIDTKLRVACNSAVDTQLAKYSPDGLERDLRVREEDFLDALRSGVEKEHVLYFCCHASLGGDATARRKVSSFLVLTDGQHINTNQIHQWMGANEFDQGPIVFLNACETGQIDPTFYEGFAGVFLDRGASAVIGTQAEMPAVFAGEFARRFFEHFFLGGPDRCVGHTLLKLRRLFLDEYKNPLGLLYSLYSGADVHLPTAIPLASS